VCYETTAEAQVAESPSARDRRPNNNSNNNNNNKTTIYKAQ